MASLSIFMGKSPTVWPDPSSYITAQSGPSLVRSPAPSMRFSGGSSLLESTFPFLQGKVWISMFAGSKTAPPPKHDGKVYGVKPPRRGFSTGVIISTARPKDTVSFLGPPESSAGTMLPGSLSNARAPVRARLTLVYRPVLLLSAGTTGACMHISTSSSTANLLSLIRTLDLYVVHPVFPQRDLSLDHLSDPTACLPVSSHHQNHLSGTPVHPALPPIWRLTSSWCLRATT